MPKISDILDCPKKSATQPSGQTTKDYSISIVTPLFGGGVKAGEPDETFPIRGTSIRGQLQFWWRATRGAGFTDYQSLFSRHAEVWGSTERASPVAINICEIAPAKMQPCAKHVWNPNARGGQGGWRLEWAPRFGRTSLPYALFPFQGKEPTSRDAAPEKDPAEFIEGVSFKLKLRYPAELRDDVEMAVRAWVNFGGIGARTRRGCGAVLCEELAPKKVGDIEKWFSTSFPNAVDEIRDWPTMPRRLLIGAESKTPLDAWKIVVGVLQNIRQGEGLARNPGTQPRRPGRSRYPEPETIRRITGKRSPQHSRLSHIPDDAFPRAEFGLPIVFHFQGAGEPPDTELYPSPAPNGERRERMASPLILKPLALADGSAVPLIMHLITRPMTGVLLKQDNKLLDLPETTVVRDRRLAEYRDSPLKGSAGSALEAFLSHACKPDNGFHEIAR